MIVTNLSGMSKVQHTIMIHIDQWSRSNKIPITRKNVIHQMTENGIDKATVIYSLRGLCRKGYIRPAVTTSNTTSYVQTRTITI